MKKPARIALFAFLAGGIAFAEPSTGEVRIRQALADSAAAAAGKGSFLSPQDLGTWNDVLTSSLFLLFRKTELYRGSITLSVENSPDAGAAYLTGGTFKVTSGLLDGVDEELFARTAAGTGRTRDMDDSRERLVLPYLAYEAARFALDQPYRAAARRFADNPATAQTLPWAALTAPSEAEVFAADTLALSLLAAAGYDAAVYGEWLSSLNARVRSGNPGNALAYLSPLPAPAARLENLRANAGNAAADSTAIRAVLRDLRTGTGAEELQEALAGLTDRYPDSPYFIRLRAFASHLRWLTEVEPARLSVATVLPFAREGSAEFERLAPLIADSVTALTAAPVSARPAWTEAAAAYEELAGKYSDPVAESAYAMLLAYSGDKTLLARSRRIADTAAAAETGTRAGRFSFAARANQAAVTLLTGKDTLKASFLFEGLISDFSANRGAFASPWTVPTGTPGDTRILLLNAILAAKRNGDPATALRSRLLELAVPKSLGRITARGLTNGDDSDAVLDKWGTPAEIVYNLESETWYYPGLNATVTLAPAAGSRASALRTVGIGPRSPVSPGGDIRTNDTRSQFENAFGKPAWVSGDREVYLVNGNRVSVLYLGGDGQEGLTARIREITVEFADAAP